jgi:hypothetical protein
MTTGDPAARRIFIFYSNKTKPNDYEPAQEIEIRRLAYLVPRIYDLRFYGLVQTVGVG